jgi:hypothetical protein
MHMPLAPEANLRIDQYAGDGGFNIRIHVLDKLLGLDVGHAMDASNTVTSGH